MATENDPFAKFRAKPGASRPHQPQPAPRQPEPQARPQAQPQSQPQPATTQPEPEPARPAEPQPEPAAERPQTRAAADEVAAWATQERDGASAATRANPTPQPKAKPEAAAAKPTSTKPDHEPMDPERRKNLIAGFSTLGVVAVAICFVLFTVFGPKPAAQEPADDVPSEQTDDTSDSTDGSTDDEDTDSDDEDDEPVEEDGVFINDFLDSDITDELSGYDLNNDGVLSEKETRYLTNLSLDTISSGDLATLAELPSIKVLSLQELPDLVDFSNAPDLEELIINNLSAPLLNLQPLQGLKKVSIGIAPSVYDDGPIDEITASNLPDLESFEITNPTTFDDHIAVKVLDLTRDSRLKTLGIYRTVDTLNLTGCSDTFKVTVSLATVNRVIYDADTDPDSLSAFQQDRADSEHPTTFEKD